MTIEQLYKEITTKGNSLCYPFDYRTQNIDFFSYWESLVDRYLLLVSQLTPIDVARLNSAFNWLPPQSKPKKKHDFLRDVKAIAEATRDFYNLSFGYRNDAAFMKMRKFMTDNQGFYFRMLPRFETVGSTWYRVRSNLGIKPNYDDGEMFHIPFELREKVGASRFGFPGYPILYLAGSLETALCELNNPRPYVCAKFKICEHIKLLDMSFPWKINIDTWEYYSILAFYPLLIGCMVTVKEPQDNYKPEYVLPQTLTKILRYFSDDFAGIIYMSNKTTEPIDSLKARNIALLVDNTNARSGYDTKSLAPKLKMNAPTYVLPNQVTPLLNNNFHSLQLP